MEERIAFVLLNFNGYEKSVICVDNLLEKLSGDYIIIIVDNGSKDGSGKKLYDRYEKNELVDFVLLDSNLGFSRGMNAGFEKAKAAGYNYIALINNDTKILSDHICEIMVEDYRIFQYDVLGPKIKNPDGDTSPNQNPYHGVEMNDHDAVEYYKKKARAAGWQLTLYKIRLDDIYFFFGKVHLKLQYLFRKSFRQPLDHAVSMKLKNRDKMEFHCGLHGSYMIFSPSYVKKYNGLIPVTFAYGEEWILYRQCCVDDLLIMYEPRIVIWHDEHSVQNNMPGSEKEKYYNRLKIERKANQDIVQFMLNERKNGKCCDGKRKE